MIDRLCREWDPGDRIDFFYNTPWGAKKNPFKSPVAMESDLSKLEDKEEAVTGAYYELYHDDWPCDRIIQETLYHNPDYCCEFCTVENQPHADIFYLRSQLNAKW